MKSEVLGNLWKSVKEYDREGARRWAVTALEERIDPIEAINAMTSAIREIGDAFGRGELWLPDLVGAADAMKSAIPILEEEIKKLGKNKETLGTVVIGTVLGDIHDIGKAMVATLLMAEGFEVHDLGVNVKAEEFLKAVRGHKADILAMSALLTLTALEQKKVIEALKREGIRDQVKIMVGGGGITEDFAKSIGADGYDPTAVGAAKLARELVRA